MKRIVKFAKIDFLRIKDYKWIAAFPLLSVILFLAEPDSSPLFIVAYCLFAGIIFSALPCSMRAPTEAGFLQMLPARSGEQQKGHFLFSLLFTLLSFLAGLLFTLVCQLIRPSFQLFAANGLSFTAFSLVLLGTAILFGGLQLFILTVFWTKNAQVMALVRMIPGFIYLFGFSGIADQFSNAAESPVDLLQSSAGFLNVPNSVIVLAGCFLVFLALSELSAFISRRRLRD